MDMKWRFFLFTPCFAWCPFVDPHASDHLNHGLFVDKRGLFSLFAISLMVGRERKEGDISGPTTLCVLYYELLQWFVTDDWSGISAAPEQYHLCGLTHHTARFHQKYFHTSQVGKRTISVNNTINDGWTPCFLKSYSFFSETFFKAGAFPCPQWPWKS